MGTQRLPARLRRAANHVRPSGRLRRPAHSVHGRPDRVHRRVRVQRPGSRPDHADRRGGGAAMLAPQTMAFMLSLLPPERRAPVFPCSASWLASPLSPARRPAASSSPTWAGAGSSSSTSQWARVRPVQPAVAGAHGLLLHAFQSLSAASQRRAPSDHLHVSQHRTARNFAIRPRHQSRLAVPSRRRSEFRMAPEEGLEPTTLRLTALPVASPTVPARPSVSLAVLRIGRRDA